MGPSGECEPCPDKGEFRTFKQGFNEVTGFRYGGRPIPNSLNQGVDRTAELDDSHSILNPIQRKDWGPFPAEPDYKYPALNGLIAEMDDSYLNSLNQRKDWRPIAAEFELNSHSIPNGLNQRKDWRPIAAEFELDSYSIPNSLYQREDWRPIAAELGDTCKFKCFNC